MNIVCLKSTLLQRVVQHQWMVASTRTLFSKSYLGIKDYEIQRSIQLPFDSTNVAFETEAAKLVRFMKYWMHVLKKDECVEKFSEIQTNLQLIHNNPAQMKAFNFGPLVMRMCHYLNLPDQALQIFKDDKMPNMCVHLNSKIILADLLFNHGKYDQMLDIISMDIENRINFGRELCTKLNCLAIAACYKLNTEEKLKFGLELWNKTKEKELSPVHSANFLSMLAINLGHPETALEVLGSTKKSHLFNDSVNIWLIALADYGHFAEAASLIEQSKSDIPKFNIYPSVVERINECSKKYPSTDEKTNFCKLLDTIPQLTSKKTIDDILCSPIEVSKEEKIRNFSPNYRNIARINKEKRQELDI
ncbi:pentatricopeptide repeat-containing protein 2, mitochondrial-like [Contarinia nasturtii]|uniref:pentatricopeptide repeat-containing protein 2, mitochondrial-like n=1 Tax=Contarinia nasturtii TaxID=265458 RepID=UPI0012D391B1|nr:pentatricopeptide repeat-containing protein 2, mitochondrial-like [Contarinia nasturtii]